MSSKIQLPDYLILVAIAAIYFSFVVHVGSQPNPLNGSFMAEDRMMINDSLPYYRYKRIADSLQQIDNCRKAQLANKGTGIYSILAGFSSLQESNLCDPNAHKLITGKNNYYLVLPGYQLSPDAEFYMAHGKYFLRTALPDTGVILDGEAENSYRDKEIAIRYLPEEEYVMNASGREKGYALIPVSSTAFRVIQVLVYVFAIAFALYAIWILFVLPMRILYSITKGVMFSLQTVRRLYIIGWSLVAFVLVPGLTGGLFQLVFAGRIPAEISFSFAGIWVGSRGWLLAGLIILLLGRAFQKGYLVKKENELTV